MTPEEFQAAVGEPLTEFAAQCHSASLALVRSGAVEGRVARGSCAGVPGQHSWVVVGDDCYDPHAYVIDPTLWSYTGDAPSIWEGKASTRPHLPHGHGNIWQWGRPNEPVGEIIEIETEGMSREAIQFLDLVGPLDEVGWRQLAHAPVGGWPSGEIFAAMYALPILAQWFPIDIIGMTTELNPKGLYLREEATC